MDSSQARGSETVCRMEPTAAQRAALDRITAEIAAAAGLALPGTLTVRAYACGKPDCRCHADPPRLHGPYAEWTRKIGGKTVTRGSPPPSSPNTSPYSTTRRNSAPCSPSSRTSPSRSSRQAAPRSRKARRTGAARSGKRGLSPLNLWAALQPDPVCPGQPQT